MTKQTREQMLLDKINELEILLENKRIDFKETAKNETLVEINLLSAEISQYQLGLRMERKLKAHYWNDFKLTLSADEFSDLWEYRLAKEAINNKLEELTNLEKSLSFLTR